MIRPRRCAALVAAVLLAPGLAPGAVIERDWLAPGDGLLTYDTINRREWLDISESLLVPFITPEMASLPGYERFDAATDVALAELLPGGRFEGFTLATRDDVIALRTSAGIPSDRGFEGNSMRRLIDLLGPIGSNETGGRFTGGVIEEFAPDALFKPKRNAAFLRVNSPRPEAPEGYFAFTFSNSDDFYGAVGLMLYRIEIPEPSTGFIAGIYVAVFASSFGRRRSISSSRIRCDFLIHYSGRRAPCSGADSRLCGSGCVG